MVYTINHCPCKLIRLTILIPFSVFRYVYVFVCVCDIHTLVYIYISKYIYTNEKSYRMNLYQEPVRH